MTTDSYKPNKQVQKAIINQMIERAKQLIYERQITNKAIAVVGGSTELLEQNEEEITKQIQSIEVYKSELEKIGD